MYDCLLGMTAGGARGCLAERGGGCGPVVVGSRGAGGAAQELAGVAVFGLRLRAVEATWRPAAAWAQGAALGSMLLLVTALAAQLAEADGAAGVVAVLAVAAALMATATSRTAVGAVLATLAVPPAIIDANGDPWNPIVAALSAVVPC